MFRMTLEYLKEVMALIDQERDTLIRQLIEDRFYTKSTTTNKAELEITGDFITLDTGLSVSSNKVELPSQPITLPNDMGIVRVFLVHMNILECLTVEEVLLKTLILYITIQ